jgi:hypothetical protein
MQSHFNKQSSSNLDQYYCVTPKISPTSTANSCTPVSGYYEYLEDNKGDDPDLLMRFNVLGLDDLDSEQVVGGSNPRRHASESLHPRSTVKVRPKLSHGPLQENTSFRAPKNPRNTFSSKEISSTSIPPGLRPPRNPSLFVPYSSNNVTQYMRPVPVCTMPQYLVPSPVVYSYYHRLPDKPEPRRYFSTQVFPAHSKSPINTNTELSEKAILLIKEYERSGDYKKLAGEISNLAKIQSGSRFLQSEIEKSDAEFFDFILKEVNLMLYIRLTIHSMN